MAKKESQSTVRRKENNTSPSGYTPPGGDDNDQNNIGTGVEEALQRNTPEPPLIKSSQEKTSTGAGTEDTTGGVPKDQDPNVPSGQGGQDQDLRLFARRPASPTTDIDMSPIADERSDLLDYMDQGRIPMSVEGARELRAQNQSSGEQFLNGITKMVGKTGEVFVGSTAGVAYGLGAGISESISEGDLSGMQAFWDNDFNDLMLEFGRGMQEALPNYMTREEREAGLWESLGSMNFWAHDLTQGIAYTAGIILAEYATAGLATAAIPARAAHRMKSLGRLSGGAGRSASGITSEGAKGAISRGVFTDRTLKTGSLARKTLQGAGYEASVMANHHKEKLENRLTEQFVVNNGREPNENEIARIKDVANQSANKVFASNMVLVGSSNAAVFPSIFGVNFTKARSRIGRMTRRTDEGFEADVSKGRPSKLRTAGTLGRSAATEGFYEEGGQEVVDEAFMDYALRENDPSGSEASHDIMDSFDRALSNILSPQAQKEIGIGAFIGLLGGSYQAAQNRAGKQNDVDAAQKATQYANEQSDSALEAVGLNYKNANEQGSTQRMKDEALRSEDGFQFDNANEDQFFSYAKSRVDMNMTEDVIEELEHYRQMPVSEINKALGIEGTQDALTESEKEQFLDRSINKVRRVREHTDQINEIAPDVSPFYKNQLVYDLSTMESIDQRIGDLADKIYRETDGQVDWRSIEREDRPHDTAEDANERLERYREETEQWLKNVKQGLVNKKLNENPKLKEAVEEIDRLYNSRKGKTSMFDPGQDVLQRLEHLGSQGRTTKDRHKDKGKRDQVLEQEDLNHINKVRKALDGLIQADLNSHQNSRTAEDVSELTRLAVRRGKFMDSYNALLTKEGRDALDKAKKEAEEKQDKTEQERSDMQQRTDNAEETNFEDLKDGDIIEYDDGNGSSVYEFRKYKDGTFRGVRGAKKVRFKDKDQVKELTENGRIKKRPFKNDKDALGIINDANSSVQDIESAIQRIGKDNLSASVKNEAEDRIKQLKEQQREGTEDREEGEEGDTDTDTDTGNEYEDGTSTSTQYEDGQGPEDGPDQDPGDTTEDTEQQYSSTDEEVHLWKGNFVRRREQDTTDPFPFAPQVRQNRDGSVQPVKRKLFIRDPDDPTKQGNSVDLSPHLKADPNRYNPGHELKVELLEDEHQWAQRREELDPEDHWKEVPMVIVDDQGNRVDRIENYTSEAEEGRTGPEVRRDIYRALKEGREVVFQINEKQTGNSNIINLKDQDGRPVLRPVSELFQEGHGIYTRDQEGQFVRTRDMGDAVIAIPSYEYQQGQVADAPVFAFGADITALNIDTSALQNEVREGDSFTPGTAHLVIADPKGELKPLRLSTSRLSPKARDTAIKDLENVYRELSDLNEEEVQQRIEDGFLSIVAHNKNLNPIEAAVSRNGTEGLLGDPNKDPDTDPVVSPVDHFIEISPGGSITFMSPSKGRLIEITRDSAQRAFNGESFVYREIHGIERNENGQQKPRKSDQIQADFDIRDELSTFLENKRYNIDLDRVNDRNSPFTSPVTQREYRSYLEYLTSTNEHPGEDTDSEMSRPAILRSDLYSDNGSLFYDTGLVLSNPGFGDTTASEVRTTMGGKDPQPAKTTEEKDENAPDDSPESVRQAEDLFGAPTQTRPDQDTDDDSDTGERSRFQVRIKDDRMDPDRAKSWLDKRFKGIVDVGFYDVVPQYRQIGNYLQHGYFRDNAIYLWTHAEAGTEYHEAFHAVFHMFLDDQQKARVLDEAAVFYNSPREGANNELALEEYLSEGFRDHMRSSEGMSFPKRILEFFKSLLDHIKILLDRPIEVDQIYRMIEFNTMPRSLERRARTADTADINRNSLKPDHNPRQEEETINSVISLVQRTREDLHAKGYKDEDLSYSRDQENIPGLLPEARRYLFRNAFSRNGEPISQEEADELLRLADRTDEINDTSGMPQGFHDIKERIDNDQELQARAPDGYFSRSYIDQLKEWGIDLDQEAVRVSRYLMGITRRDKWYDLHDDSVASNVIERGWETLVRRKLNSFGYRIREDYSVEETTEGIQKIYNRSTFEEDPKRKLSSEVRMFLSTVPTGRFNHLGFETFVEFDRMYEKLAFELVDIETLQGMKKRVSDLARYQPDFGMMLEKLNNSSADFQKLFFYSMRNTYAKMLVQDVVSKKTRTRGQVRHTRFFEINRNNLDKRFRENWFYSAVQREGVPNPNHLYNIDNEGNISLNKQRAGNILKNFKALTDDLSQRRSGEVTSELVHKVHRVLDDFGIDLRPGEIEAHLDNEVQKNRHRDQVSALKDLVYKNRNNKGNSVDQLVKSISDFQFKKQNISGDITLKDSPGMVYDVDSGQRSIVNRFTRIKRDFSDDLIGSFVDAMSKSIYPVNIPSEMSDKFKRFTENTLFIKIDPETGERHITETYREDPRYILNTSSSKYNSPLIEDALKSGDNTLRAQFDWWDFNARKNANSDFGRVDYESSEEQDSLAMRIDAFLNRGNKDHKVMVMPTQADRMRMTMARWPHIDKFVQMTKFESRDEVLRSYLYRDINKIQQTRRDHEGELEEDYWSEGLHYEATEDENGNITKDTSKARGLEFTMLPGIEDTSIPTITGSNRKNIKLSQIDLGDLIDGQEDAVVSQDGQDHVSRQEAERVISEQIQNVKDHINEKARDDLQRLINAGVITEDPKEGIVDHEGKSIDSESSQRITQMMTELNTEDLSKLYSSKDTTTRQALNNLLRDFIWTDLVFRNELSQLMRTGREFSPNYEKFSKYWGNINTPGSKVLIQGDLSDLGLPNEGAPAHFNEATIRDVPTTQGSEQRIGELADLVEGQGHTELASSIREAYDPSNSNKTDAQAWMSIHFYREIAKAGHESWTDSHEEAYKNYNRGGRFIDDAGHRPRLKPLKPYFEGHNRTGKWAMMDMMKNSVLPLIRDFTENYEVFEDMRRRMESERATRAGQVDYSDLDPVHIINTESARKQAIIGAHNVRFEEGEFRELVPRKMRTRDLRFPQTVPDKTGQDPIFGVQPMKNILVGVQNEVQYHMNLGRDNERSIRGEQMYHLYNAMVADLVDRSMRELKEDLGYQRYMDALDSGTIEEARNAKLRYLKNLKNFIIEQSEERDLPDNYERSLNIIWDPNTKDGWDFAMPLSFPAYQRQFESILFSRFKKDVLTQRINGTNAVQVAELGGAISQTDEGAPRTRELRFVTRSKKRIQNADIEDIEHAEVAVSESMARQLGVEPGHRIDMENIPENIRTMIGYRIPHSGMNLFLHMKIVDVFPDNYESAIMVPGEITVQQGSDFDVDKLTLMAPNFRIEGLVDHVRASLKADKNFLELEEKELTDDDIKFIKGRSKDPFNTEGTEDMDQKQTLMAASVEDFFRERITPDKLKKIDFDMEGVLNEEGNVIKSKISTQSREAVENGIIDVMESVLRNESNLSRLLRPIDDPEFVNLREQYGQVEELDPFDPFTEVDLEMKNKAGAVSIGVYANAQSGQAIAAKGTMTSALEVPFKDYKEENFDEGTHILNDLSRTKDRGGITLNKNGEWTRVAEDDIYYHLNKHLSAAVDNAKDPVLSDLNDNRVTQPVTIFMESLGIKSEDTAIFRMQPVIKELARRQANSVQSVENTIGEMLQTLSYRISNERLKELREARSKSASEDTQSGDYFGGMYIMSREELENDLKEGLRDIPRDQRSEEWLVRQMEYLRNFQKMHESGTELQRVYKTLTPDTVKNVSSYAVIEEHTGKRKHTKFKQNRILGVNDTLSQVPMMERFDRVMEEITDFGDQQFIYHRPAIKDLKGRLEQLTGKMFFDENVHGRIDDLVFAYLATRSDSPMGGLMTQENAKRILRSQDNIAARLQHIKENYPKAVQNRFVRNLRPDWDQNSALFTIQFDTTHDYSKFQMDAFSGDFLDIYQHPYNYTVDPQSHRNKLSREDQIAEIRQFTEDLVAYSVLVNGFAPGMKGFTNIIPVEVWSELVNDQGENMQQYHRRVSGELNDKDALLGIQESIIRHMAEEDGFIPKIPYQEIGDQVDSQEISVSAFSGSVHNPQTMDYHEYIRVNNVKQGRHDIYQFKEYSPSTERVTYKRIQPKGRPGELIEIGLTDEQGHPVSRSIHPDNQFGEFSPEDHTVTAPARRTGQVSTQAEEQSQEQTRPEPAGNTQARRDVNAFMLTLNPDVSQITDENFDNFEESVGMSLEDYLEQENYNYRSVASEIFQKYCID